MKWIFPFLFVLDLSSKMFALKWIPTLYWGEYPFGGVPVFNFGWISFSLNTIFNTGAAWGFFSGNPGLLFVVRVGILLILALYLFFYNRSVLMKAPIWLVATGAFGNAIDYLLYGHVIDFLHFVFWGYSFPVFNFADSYITIGAILLVFIPRLKSL